MRISDWSSDVCSSDLGELLEVGFTAFNGSSRERIDDSERFKACLDLKQSGDAVQHGSRKAISAPIADSLGCAWLWLAKRSEEHTSELQSLMRISYAVFCLKNKTNTQHTTHTITNS